MKEFRGECLPKGVNIISRVPANGRLYFSAHARWSKGYGSEFERCSATYPFKKLGPDRAVRLAVLTRAAMDIAYGPTADGPKVKPTREALCKLFNGDTEAWSIIDEHLPTHLRFTYRPIKPIIAFGVRTNVYREEGTTSL